MKSIFGWIEILVHFQLIHSWWCEFLDENEQVIVWVVQNRMHHLECFQDQPFLSSSEWLTACSSIVHWTAVKWKTRPYYNLFFCRAETISWSKTSHTSEFRAKLFPMKNANLIWCYTVALLLLKKLIVRIYFVRFLRIDRTVIHTQRFYFSHSFSVGLIFKQLLKLTTKYIADESGRLTFISIVASEREE